MFCEKCGAKNNSSNNFCEKCGNKLKNEVKETKNNKKQHEKKFDVKSKLNTLSKKQKIVGELVLLLIISLVIFYMVGSKITSLKTLGVKAFEELADKSTISNKYLSVPLNNEDYFISLGDLIKEKIEAEEISFDYDDYTLTTGKKKITIKYYDNKDEEYKVTFSVKKDGKKLLIFDKYVITKITVENYDTVTLYDPQNVEKIILSAVKGSKITINDKEVSNSYIDSKKSDDKNDVYVIKGVARGDYEVKFSLGNLLFEKTLYAYSDNNEYDLSDYISYSYLSDDTKNFEKAFQTYINTYYEYVNDTSKTIEDFDKKYKVTDDIREEFVDAREYSTNISSFKIDEVALSSLYYYSSDEELAITYKVNYTYKLIDTEEEKTSYENVRVTYDLSNLELPKSLSYMPY